MGLNFMHPALLVGVLAACLPWLIQKLGQQRAPVIAFAAFDFLLQTKSLSASQRRRFRWLLLLVRTMLVLLLVLALARPVQQEKMLAQAAVGEQQVALVLDVSASMGYVLDNKTLLEHAFEKAEAYISNLHAADSVTLIVASDVVRMPCGTRLHDHKAVVRCMREQKLTQKRADLSKALVAVQNLWAEQAPDVSPQVIVLSDFAANSWSEVASWATSPVQDIHLLDAAGRQKLAALPNLAIEDVEITVPQDAEHVLFRQFDITLHNFGLQPVSARRVALRVDGHTVLQARLESPGRSRVHKILSYTFATAGEHLVEVRLDKSVSDGFAQDDVWRQKIYLAPSVQVLAVQSDTQVAAPEDAFFFLERAVAKTPAGQSPIALQTCHLSQMQARLAHQDPSFDAVILLDLPSLTTEQADALRQFVKRDKGLFFTLGAATDFEATNAQIPDLLPRALRDRTTSLEPNQAQARFGIETLNWSHPILHDLDRNVAKSLEKTHTKAHFHLETGQQEQAETILAFAHNAPALLEQRRRQGRVLLWTSSFDLQGGDVVLSSAFVPLIQRSLRYLAHPVFSYNASTKRAPARVALPMPATCDAACLQGPGSEGIQGTGMPPPEQDSARKMMQFSALDDAGYYQARVRCEGVWKQAPELDVVINPSLEESDFAPIEADLLAKMLHTSTQKAETAQLGPQALPHGGKDYGAVALLWLWSVVLIEGLLAARS